MATKYGISIIGYGNLSYRLSIALKIAGHNINFICGNSLEKAQKLTAILNKAEHSHSSMQETHATTSLKSVLSSDIVLLAVPDSAIEELSSKLLDASGHSNTPIILHASGASPMELLSKFNNYGVFYPLMTLSATKPVEFSLVPFFLEGSNPSVLEVLVELATSLKAEYKIADSQERAKMHVAAVFVSNFVNYMAGLAYDISAPNQMFLMPLAVETIRKAFLFGHPKEVQTGPAVRRDFATIERHIELLKELPEHLEVYKLITNNLMNKNIKL